MAVAILDPFSGISGDMLLGALIDVGLDAEWLRALPARLGLDGVAVRVEAVRRAGIACRKVEVEIPPQPHGRGIDEIRALLQRAEIPSDVASQADLAFSALASAEGEVHGIPAARVHLHEVGAVDAIVDIVGAVWGLRELGVGRVFCGPVRLGDGTVRAAHGELPVPAPATLKLLEGHDVVPGPPGTGELATPTGAALVRVLSSGPPPAAYVPRRSGFGAGSRELEGRANALRVVLAELAPVAGGAVLESLVHLATDVDDMDGESLAGAVDRLREVGALDVVLVPTLMKKGRPGVRVEVLVAPQEADRLEALLLTETTSIGVRRTPVERHALRRADVSVRALEHDLRIKVVTLPDGRRRAKPEFEDVRRVAAVTGRTLREVYAAAAAAAERVMTDRVSEPAGR